MVLLPCVTRQASRVLTYREIVKNANGKPDKRKPLTAGRLVHSEEQPARLFIATEELLPMCDYSLHHVATRPAQVGDKLVTTKFNNSITRGFAAIGEPNVAVCLLPGTEVAFEANVECEPAIGILPTKKIGQRMARFRQVNIGHPTVHHDSLEFPDGQLVLLTRLCEGQCATVLQLPASAKPVHESGTENAAPQASEQVDVRRSAFID
jgi:hypothetical protein